MAVFCQVFGWAPSQVRSSLVGDLDMLWRLSVYDRIEGGDASAWAD